MEWTRTGTLMWLPCSPWWGERVTTREGAVYVVAQIVGAIAGAIPANAMFAQPLVKWSTHDRSAGHVLLSEGVATAGLILLISGLAHSHRIRFAAAAVAAYVGAGFWFTASTCFANPAVTIGRAFSDTFDGIQPSSVPVSSGCRCSARWSVRRWWPSSSSRS